MASGEIGRCPHCGRPVCEWADTLAVALKLLTPTGKWAAWVQCQNPQCQARGPRRYSSRRPAIAIRAAIKAWQRRA